MRDFKELLIGQGKDLFHKNMRKFGATVLESHQAFKDIEEGNIEGGGNGGGVGYLYFENVPPMVEPLLYSSLINDGTRIIPSFFCGFNSQGKEENITVHMIAAPYGYTLNGMKITKDYLREFMSVGRRVLQP